MQSQLLKKRYVFLTFFYITKALLYIILQNVIQYPNTCIFSEKKIYWAKLVAYLHEEELICRKLIQKTN